MCAVSGLSRFDPRVNRTAKTPASPLPQPEPYCDALAMTQEKLQKRLRWLALERIVLDERGAAADIIERNEFETVRLQRKLSFAHAGHPQPSRVA